MGPSLFTTIRKRESRACEVDVIYTTKVERWCEIEINWLYNSYSNQILPYRQRLETSGGPHGSSKDLFVENVIKLKINILHHKVPLIILRWRNRRGVIRRQMRISVTLRT